MERTPGYCADMRIVLAILTAVALAAVAVGGHVLLFGHRLSSFQIGALYGLLLILVINLCATRAKNLLHSIPAGMNLLLALGSICLAGTADFPLYQNVPGAFPIPLWSVLLANGYFIFAAGALFFPKRASVPYERLLFKQMRQRALSTSLTLVSVILGVALAITIMICQREGRAAFGQTDYGYDVLIGPRGSGLTLTLNTVYHMDASQGNVPFEEYAALANARGTLPGSFPKDFADAEHPAPPSPVPVVSWVVPYAVGDSYQGMRIVATMPLLFAANLDGTPVGPDVNTNKIPTYRPGQRYEMAEGRAFAYNKFEAVIGSEVAERTGLTVGKKFQATHGMPKPGEIPDIHDEIWTVVGILKKTYTANDRVLFIPLMSFYAISEHEAGEEQHARYHGKMVESKLKPGDKAYTLNPDNTIALKLPLEEWEVSAILLKTPAPTLMNRALDVYKNRPDTMAVNPALVMADFFDNILSGITNLLVLITSIVVIVAAVSILVSIYNSVAARNREVAILRALGATRDVILTLVCLEATFIGAVGGILGIVAGHLAAAAASSAIAARIGHGISWWNPSLLELAYLEVVIALAFLAGLAPAFKAFRTPVAANLVAE